MDDYSPSLKQKPSKASLYRSVCVESHWKCFTLSLMLIGCLSTITWCKLQSTHTSVLHLSIESTLRDDMTFYDDHHDAGFHACDDTYVYIPVAFVLMIYIVYLVECWNCRLRSRLADSVDMDTVYSHIRALTQAKPVVWWRAVCYHYIRCARQVARYRNGDALSTAQVYFERCNTHIGSSSFDYTRCGVKDASRRLVGLADFPTVTVQFTKRFSFATREAEREYEQQRARFFSAYEHRDDYLETREGVDFIGVTFRDHVISFVDPRRRPWYVSGVFFWIFSVLLLSWPVRILIQYKTAHVHFYVHKVFGRATAVADSGQSVRSGNVSSFNHASVQNQPCDEQTGMPRDDTMQSLTYDVATTGSNYTLVPSYSEALLMDCITSGNNAEDNSRRSLTPKTLAQSLTELRRSISRQFNPHDIDVTTPLLVRDELTGHITPTNDRVTLQHSQTPLGGFSTDTKFKRLRRSVMTFLKAGFTANRPPWLSADMSSSSSLEVRSCRSMRNNHDEAPDGSKTLKSIRRSRHDELSCVRTPVVHGNLAVYVQGSKSTVSPSAQSSSVTDRMKAIKSTPESFNKCCCTFSPSLPILSSMIPKEKTELILLGDVKHELLALSETPAVVSSERKSAHVTDDKNEQLLGACVRSGKDESTQDGGYTTSTLPPNYFVLDDRPMTSRRSLSSISIPTHQAFDVDNGKPGNGSIARSSPPKYDFGMTVCYREKSSENQHGLLGPDQESNNETEETAQEMKM